ncbi:MAG: riboflavin biosynthesis protein RibD [Legionella sp.]|nr:MAG: riboflavin biosynthesis protein RibD [Legionella sp.]
MHKEYLLSALAQAKLGRGICAPNPSVGAVAVQQDHVIAKAYHKGAGSPHAEQILLKQLPAVSQDVTLYVTLEPCNHWGRTPPCTEAIIAHGIKRVVYAYNDPNPLVSENQTPRILREHGVEVLHYPLPEIDEFYKSYHYWMQTKKPWVTVKIAQTLDGQIAGRDGARISISNQECAEFTHIHRKQTDVILTTSRTLIQDNPQLTVRLENTGRETKPLAVLDTHLSVPHEAQALQLAAHGMIYYDGSHEVSHRHLNCAYYPMPAPQQRLDLTAVLGHLGALGYHDVWVEAGSQLFTALHQAHLVNRTHIYIAPKILNEKGVSLYSNLNHFDSAHSLSWQVMGDNVILTIDW